MGIKFIPGYRRSPYDKRTLKLDKYIGTDFLDHPFTCDWTKGVITWPMMLNDQEGDCVCASAGHMIMGWTAANGDLYVPADSDVQKAYVDNSGYDPSTGANDNGCTLSGVLGYWQKTGIGGHKIGAYVQIDPKNYNHICAAIYWFGGVFSAIEVDQFMEDEFNAGAEWTVPINPATWTPLGGHGVPLLAFEPKQFNLITWARNQAMSYNCWWKVGMEAWCMISQDFISGNKPSPSGFNMGQLVADLQKVKE
jgi:hypothetical protein